MEEHKEILIKGFPVSEGIAIGIPFFLQPIKKEIPEFPITLKEVDDEIARYRSALFSSRQDLTQLRTHLAEEASDDAATIIDTHIQMLEDPLMTVHMEEKIRQTLQNPEAVFQSVITDYEKRFSQTTDAFFQERWLVDVMDLANRVLGHLCPCKGTSLINVPFNSVVFAKELTPSHTASAQTVRVSAFVTQSGGGNSHAALIARSKGIPYVACIDVDVLQNIPSKCVIVDGQAGDVIFNPNRLTLEKYKQRKTCMKATFQLLQKEMQYDAETIDGCNIQVFANIGNIEDLENINQYGIDGIGLFRTEYLFFQHRQLISSEEEQYRAYAELIRTVGKAPIIIRVFDVGGDKNPDLFSEEREPNPVLGCRGIRFLLRHQEIFKTQLRALLRAAVHGDVRILLPLISDISELESSRALIAELEHTLRSEGIDFKANIPLGCMIEVPSAVLICDALAKRSDFLSIGTNDLVQYTLGIDRSNPAMSDFCYPAHPSVLRMIKMVNTEAKRHGKTVSICGEIASNPLFVPLLLGLGFDRLSCSPRHIPKVKRAIRQTSLLAAYELAQRVLRLNSTMEVSQALLEAYNHSS